MGNLVLDALGREFGAFCKHRSGGTTFETDGHVWIARVVARGYLGEGDAHWANASYSQFARVVDQTNRIGKQLMYLFITALPDEDIRYWIVPGSVIGDLFERRGKDLDGGTTTIHIKDRDGASWLDGVDVSACERRLADPGRAEAEPAGPDADAESDARTGAVAAPPRAGASSRRTPRPSGSGAAASLAADAGRSQRVPPKASAPSTRSFDIPLSGGRVARLALPNPVGEVDVDRVTKWIELMRDVLTEDDASTVNPDMPRA